MKSLQQTARLARVSEAASFRAAARSCQRAVVDLMRAARSAEIAGVSTDSRAIAECQRANVRRFLHMARLIERREAR